MSRNRGSQDRPRRKRRPDTAPRPDAHPASTGGTVIHRQMTPQQIAEYQRSCVMPPSPDIPLVGMSAVPVLPPQAGSPWLKRSPDSTRRLVEAAGAVTIDPPTRPASRTSADDPGESL